MQVVGMPGVDFHYTGMFNAVKVIFAKEGIRGFFKGMLPNYLKVAPATGASFVTYEWSKKLLGTH